MSDYIKINDNSLKMTTYKIYTYEDIQNRIVQLTSERDGQQSNLNLLNAEIERFKQIIIQTGIASKETNLIAGDIQ